jgi:predicted ATPase
MKRYILTGAPGSGKTAVLRQLELDGFGVVEEAATDLIALRQAEGVAEPWMQAGFVEDVARLQRLRLERTSKSGDAVQFHDRSIFCTLALAKYLAVPCPAELIREAERVREERVYERSVFFLENLGFIEPTAARRITFEETVRFERIHEEVYREWGFEPVMVEAAPLEERVRTIGAFIELSAR